MTASDRQLEFDFADRTPIAQEPKRFVYDLGVEPTPGDWDHTSLTCEFHGQTTFVRPSSTKTKYPFIHLCVECMRDLDQWVPNVWEEPAPIAGGYVLTVPKGAEIDVEPLKQGVEFKAPHLSQDSAERKNTPIYSGVLQYFPLAIAAVARHSKRGNDKHNPGEPLHWAREKSNDLRDCAARHLVDVDHFNPELNEYEEACALAWRALAILELLEEKRLGR